MSVAAKICGLSTEAAVTTAVAGGASYLGFVFYSPSPRVLAEVPIDILQFHGRESPDQVADAKLRFARPIMKAVAIAAPEDVRGAAQYEEAADLLLFDAKPPCRPDALPGGNGLAFDWGLIAGRSWRRQWMLSGGLTAELLPEAVRISGAASVDVSSGVESRPGEKDLDKIRAFLAAARALG